MLKSQKAAPVAEENLDYVFHHIKKSLFAFRYLHSTKIAATYFTYLVTAKLKEVIEYLKHFRLKMNISDFSALDPKISSTKTKLGQLKTYSLNMYFFYYLISN